MYKQCFFFRANLSLLPRHVKEPKKEEKKRTPECVSTFGHCIGPAYLILVVLVWLRLGCRLTGALYPLLHQQIHQPPQAADRKLSLKCFDINPYTIGFMQLKHNVLRMKYPVTIVA